jgi:hypothetical protein
MVGDTAMWPYLHTIDPTTRWRMEKGSRRSGGRVLVDSGAVVSARELTGVEVAMVARFLRVEDERGREKEWRQHRCTVAPLKTPWTDRWGHGWRTAATARPHVGTGLWPVGHTELTKLNVTESTMPMTD